MLPERQNHTGSVLSLGWNDIFAAHYGTIYLVFYLIQLYTRLRLHNLQCIQLGVIVSVSYTHLDVYKRQEVESANDFLTFALFAFLTEREI